MSCSNRIGFGTSTGIVQMRTSIPRRASASITAPIELGDRARRERDPRGAAVGALEHELVGDEVERHGERAASVRRATAW